MLSEKQKEMKFALQFHKGFLIYINIPSYMAGGQYTCSLARNMLLLLTASIRGD